MKLIKESDYLLLWLVAAVLAAALLLHKAQMFHLTHNTVNLSMTGPGPSLQPLQHLVLVVPGPGSVLLPMLYPVSPCLPHLVII